MITRLALTAFTTGALVVVACILATVGLSGWPARTRPHRWQERHHGNRRPAIRRAGRRGTHSAAERHQRIMLCLTVVTTVSAVLQVILALT